MKTIYEFEGKKNLNNSIMLIVLMFLLNVFIIFFTKYSIINVILFSLVVLLFLMNNKIIRSIEIDDCILKITYYRFLKKKSIIFKIRDLTFKIEKFGSLREKPQDYLYIIYKENKIFSIGKKLFIDDDDFIKLNKDFIISKNKCCG